MDRLLEVGRIGRPHGVRGHLLVSLVTDRTERVAPGARLRAGEDRWLTVEASRPQSSRWVVAFEGVGDRDAAERLVNRPLFAEPLAATDDDALWVHELIGADVVERDGTVRGRCVAVIDNPAHDLLELDNGALVPIVFVVELTDGRSGGPREIVIEPPDGLFD